MAIFTPGVVIGQISGKVGGYVFSRNRGGSYIRNSAIPSTVTTKKALAYKSYLSSASQQWQTEDAGDRQAWATFAQTKTSIDRLGKSISLTAHNWYVRLNSRLLAAGESVISIPPVDPPPGVTVVTSWTVDVLTGKTSLVYTPSPLPAGVGLWIRAAKLQSPTIINVQNLLTTILITPGAQTSPLDLEDELVAAFGPIQEGATYVLEIRAFDRTTGLVGGRVYARTVAVDTTP